MEQAFDILGIEPTADGRAIRAAFLRLARIYHPDRFAGMPEDVRDEAERRMKEATLAYESLRGRRREEAPATPKLSAKDLRERADRYQKTIEAKQAEEKRNRARWRRWDEIEKQARQRAELDAQIAAAIAKDANGWERLVSTEAGRADADSAEPSTKRTGEKNGNRATKPEGVALAERLAAARGGSASPLVKRSE